MHSFNQDLSKIPLTWLPRARDSVDIQGVSPETAEAVARDPEHVVVDPSSKLVEGRYYAERRRRGDVTVVVAFPPNDYPIIWGVYYNLPLPVLRKRDGGGGGTTVPTTMRELRRRIVEAGLVIKSGGKHDRVETRDGTFVFSLSISPSDRRFYQNAARQLAKKGYDVTR